MKEKRVDHRFSRLLHEVRRAAEHARLRGIHERGIRLTMYRAAVEYRALMIEEHDAFMKLVSSYDKSADRMIEEWFAPLRLIDEDPHELFKAVGDGMTQKQWMTKGARSFIAGQRSSDAETQLSRAKAVAQTPVPDAKLADGEKLARYQQRDSERETVLRRQADVTRTLKAEVAKLTAENTRLRNKLETVQRRIRRLERDLQPIVP